MIVALAMGVGVAMLLAIGQWKLAAPLTGLLVAPVLFALLIRHLDGRSDALFWLALVAAFSSSFILATTKVDLRFVLELVVYAAAPLLFARLLPHLKRSAHLKWLLVFGLAFLALSVVATLTGRSRSLPALYTMVYNVKPFVMLGFGACLVWSSTTERRYLLIVRWAWLLFLATAILQWSAPSVYTAILSDFKAEQHPFFAGMSRAKTVFHHPALAATVASALAIVCAARWAERRSVSDALAIGGYFAVVLMAGQRHELVALLATFIFVGLLWRYPMRLGSLLVSSVLVGVVTIAVLYPLLNETIDRELVAWGIVGRGMDPENIRAVLYQDASRVAERYFPWGSGLGTFGSAGAMRYDLSLYFEMGYQHFWWFGKQSVLMDAFWTRYIAETGWLGLTLMVAIYALTLQRALGWIADAEQGTRERFYSVCGCGGLIFLLIASPTSFGLAEPLQGLLPLVPLGVAWNLRRQRLAQARE